MKEIRRGEVFIADLAPVQGSEQGGVRPCLVIQNDVGNKHSPTVIVAPITSHLKKRNMPTHVTIPDGLGFPARSMVLLEHIRTIDKSRLVKYMTNLTPDVMEEIDAALAVSIGLSQPKYEEMELSLCPNCAKQFFDSGHYILKRVNVLKNEKSTCCYCNVRSGNDYRIINKEKHYVSSM